jgi:uncharacterized membrane protein
MMLQKHGSVKKQAGGVDKESDLRYIPLMESSEPTLRELLDRLPETPANRVLAAVGYVPFLFFLPVFANREDEFARFHGKQSLILLAGLVGAWALIWLIDVILGGILSHIFLIGVVFRMLAWLVHYVLGGAVSIAYFIAIIYGATQALAGSNRAIPLVGVYARQLPL